MNKQHEFTVEQETQLLPFLLEKYAGTGRNKVKALLTRGQVMVGTRVVTRHDHGLSAGDRVKILSTGSVQQRELMAGVKIMYEDDAILVIDKPPGLLSIATDEEKERTAYHIMVDHVRTRDPKSRVFIVHRLDKETSGLMMFAKTEAIKRQLQDNWKDTVIERSYVALVEGAVEQDQATIKTWLKESVTKTMYVSRPGDGMIAITHYQVIERTPEFSLLAVQLETGRKNQIRVHMQSIGHSVVGDKRYGSKHNPIGRLGLHAQILSFKHPVTEETLRFETAIPDKFRAALSGNKPTRKNKTASN
ncbi:RluA family pseudouridine synthase [Alicyclobacillus tolerans]|uniref:RluA family pseudouridine synthase n=1 Tax=Alicyclobacillus tolerans TaxID=90970 RepID=UPI001F41FF26|nr:RluA family pseudouridine synthase [Alicyclobacillus tolerans]MCF8564884.1 RluA family pseudouridine synthase [Alicyclobacillus tolerans]